MGEDVQMPMDFILVRAAYPVDLERQLGYGGQARFVGFYWDMEEDDAVCDDGRSGPAPADWEAFIRYVAPLGPHFRVTLGNSDEEATHIFIWDRAQQAAYLADREEGEEFLKSSQKLE